MTQIWLQDSNNPKVAQLKHIFAQALSEMSQNECINYYDFLLVAKKLNFRFEQSAHLMSLKRYFSQKNNSVNSQKLLQMIMFNQEQFEFSLDKIVVKFNVPEIEFAPIKELTNEDENEEDEERFEPLGDTEDKETNEKMIIILSIKVEEMQLKLRTILGTDGCIFSIFEHYNGQQMNYKDFRKELLSMIALRRDKIKVNDEDIKTIFHLLDVEHKQYIAPEDLEALRNLESIIERMKAFYKERINYKMVKNTLFKLGKTNNNNIQIYQLKNPSLVEFETLEGTILDQKPLRYKRKNRQPHFGPLKGTPKKGVAIPENYSTQQYLRSKELNFQREKIYKILRTSKEGKKRDKNGETVASKLRSLFIHKVILPREKMLEEEQQKYTPKQNLRGLSIRPSK